MTRFGMVWPALKFRLDAVGSAVPPGNTRRCPAARASVTVTFSATAVAPAGTLLVGSVIVTVRCAPIGPRAPSPVRVSRTRVGLTGWNDDPVFVGLGLGGGGSVGSGLG